MLPEGRLSYPQPIVSGRSPLALTAFDADGDGRIELAYLDNEGGTRSVAVLKREGARWAEAQRIELAGLRTDPLAIESLDADQDGRPDLVVFTLRSPLRLLLQGDDGSFDELSAAEGLRTGLVDNLLPVGLSRGDVDGDGRDEMIVVGKGYARALRLSPAGVLEVVDQFNASSSDVDVRASFVTDTDGDGVVEVLLAQEDSNQIALLRRDRKGVYRQRASIPVGPIQLVDTRVLDLDGNGRDDLLFLGKDRFWSAPVGAVDLRVRTLERHEPDLDDLTYVELASGDLDGDGTDELVAIDSRQTHILQVLARNGEGAWESVVHFEVFEVDPHYAGRSGSNSEPREVLIADLTSDGKQDVVLLIHDRILLYPGR